MMERRTYPRVPLDTPFFVTLEFQLENIVLSAMIIDVSRGGIQVSIPPQQGDPALLLGKQVLIKNLPPEFKSEGSRCLGTVTWVSRQRCGVRFKSLVRIMEHDLLDLLQQL